MKRRWNNDLEKPEAACNGTHPTEKNAKISFTCRFHNRVLDEHLLFCRRLRREMSALMPKQKTPSWICSKAAFYYV